MPFVFSQFRILVFTYVIVEFRLFGDTDVFWLDELSDLGESSFCGGGARTELVLMTVLALFRLFCGGGYSFDVNE